MLEAKIGTLICRTSEKKDNFFSNVKKNIDIGICDCTLMWCSSVEWAGIIGEKKSSLIVTTCFVFNLNSATQNR